MTADLLLTGARVVDARRDLPDAWVRVRSGLIAEVGTGLAPRASERIDLGGATLTPGLIDLHVHGGGGHAFDDGADAIAAGVAAYRRHGTTATLVSLVSSPIDVLRQQLDGVDVGGVEVLPVHDGLALDARPRDHLVHAVERPQEGRLATA